MIPVKAAAGVRPGVARTTAIIGDAGTQQATVLPDLNTISNDDYVKVTTNSGMLDVFQTLFIRDNIYETRVERVYPTLIQSPQLSFQFSTMGWVKKTDMCIELVYRITHPAFSVAGMKASVGVNNISPTIAARAGIENCILYGAHPEWAILNSLREVRMYWGNNNQPIGRAQQWTNPGLKVQMSDQKFNNTSVKVAGTLGLPYARFSDASQTQVMPNTPCEQEFLDAWRNQLSAPRRQDPYAATAYDQLQVAVIPLSFINSFFRDDSYIPPDTKFKIDIFFKTIEGTISTCHVGYTDIIANPQVKMTWDINNGANRLIYMSDILRQPLQKALNDRWLTSPFLYNYEVYENYDIVGDGATSTWYRDIAISMQRPTEIIFQFVNNTDSCYNQTGENRSAFTSAQMIAAKRLETKTLQNLTARNRDHTFEIDGLGSAIFDNAGSPHPAIEYIRITIGGRLQFEWDRTLNENTLNNGHTMQTRGFNYLYSIRNDQNYNVYNSKFGTLTLFNGMQFCNDMETTAPMKLCITPGGEVDRGSISSDMGSHNIRIEIKFIAALQAYTKLIIWKKQPEQMTLDANRNVIAITWPAVKSNAGYTMPNTGPVV